MVNVLTVDVEDWYTSSLDVLPGAQAEHGQKPDESVVANTLSLLHLLSTHGHRATFFILGTVAEHYPEVVQAIAEGGHEVALHGYSHRLVYEMSPEEFRCDLAKGRELVEAAGAVGPFGYRAPYWSITKKSLWALEVLRAEGIRYDASIFPIGRQLYGIPDAPTGPHTMALPNSRSEIWEFPPATLRLLGKNVPISGGGYLRLFPYCLIRSGIRRLNSAGQPAIMYLHPYELDPSDVNLPGELAPSSCGGLSYRLQRLNRDRNPRKIRRLLDDFSFSSIDQVFASLLGVGQENSGSSGGASA
jgi:polysaccharide deacetylase family protein (PEP-CTERM system associated)